jgi:enoyl-CoA hydratase/carnithine racemase
VEAAVVWSIERRSQHVALVTMNTNKVNSQNPTFFEDLHRAFDRLEAEFNDCGVVLTGTGRVFSAGLDFDHHFPLFARRSTGEVDAWFEAYRTTNLRIFTYPRPTVAAINGHAYAGGLITALGCDLRIAAAGDLQFALQRSRKRTLRSLLRANSGHYRAERSGPQRQTTIVFGVRSISAASDCRPLMSALLPKADIS